MLLHQVVIAACLLGGANHIQQATKPLVLQHATLNTTARNHVLRIVPGSHNQQHLDDGVVT